MKTKKTYEKFELAGLLAGVTGGFLPDMLWRNAAAAGFFALASALTAVAAYLHWKLPAEEKEQIRFYMFSAPSHVYLSFLLALTMLLLAAVRITYGVNPVLYGIFLGLMLILFCIWKDWTCTANGMYGQTRRKSVRTGSIIVSVTGKRRSEVRYGSDLSFCRTKRHAADSAVYP